MQLAGLLLPHESQRISAGSPNTYTGLSPYLVAPSLWDRKYAESCPRAHKSSDRRILPSAPTILFGLWCTIVTRASQHSSTPWCAICAPADEKKRAKGAARSSCACCWIRAWTLIAWIATLATTNTNEIVPGYSEAGQQLCLHYR
jgi:hypothetical protein